MIRFISNVIIRGADLTNTSLSKCKIDCPKIRVIFGRFMRLEKKETKMQKPDFQVKDGEPIIIKAFKSKAGWSREDYYKKMLKGGGKGEKKVD